MKKDKINKAIVEAVVKTATENDCKLIGGFILELLIDETERSQRGWYKEKYKLMIEKYVKKQEV
jgi:hypothetical protein